MRFTKFANKSGEQPTDSTEKSGEGEGTADQRARFNQLIGSRSLAFSFGPGLFFIILAVVTVLAPQLILAVVAGVFLFIGALLCYLAWKFVQMKKSFEAMSEKFKGTAIQVHGVSIGGNPFEQVIVDDDDDDDEDTIIIH